MACKWAMSPGWRYVPIYPEQPEVLRFQGKDYGFVWHTKGNWLNGSLLLVCALLFVWFLLVAMQGKEFKTWWTWAATIRYLWETKQIYREGRRENMCMPKRKGFSEKLCCRNKDGAVKSATQNPSYSHPSPRNRWLYGHSPYLFCSDHGNHVCSLLPHHLPEVMARVWQGPLSGYVVPFCPTNHHLETKESKGEQTPNPA